MIKLDWQRIDSLSEIAPPKEGIALFAIGMDNCDACDIVAGQIETFISMYGDVMGRLYKFSSKGRPQAELQLMGQELRFFPTVLGFVDGDLAFRLQGVLADTSPTDVKRLERGFARFAANRS